MISITTATEADRVAGDQARIAMMRRGLSNADLAALTGLSKSTVKSIKAGMPRRRGRTAIERALGIPIWSSAQEFHMRTVMLERLGIDPALVNIPQLRVVATQIKAPGRSGVKTRRALIALIWNSLSEHAAEHLARPAPAAPEAQQQPAVTGRGTQDEAT